MEHTMDIYGNLVMDPEIVEEIKRMRENKPKFSCSKILEEWIRTLMENLDDDFYLYIHKTRNEDIMQSIIWQGLEVREVGGGLESTMSRVLDSTSIDLEGDINYFLNSLKESPSGYGECSIVAVIPKNYASILIPKGDIKVLPRNFLAFAFNGDLNVLRGPAYTLGLPSEKKLHIKS